MGFLPTFVDFYSIDGFYYPWHDFPFQLGSTNQLTAKQYKPAKYVQSCRVIPKCQTGRLCYKIGPNHHIASHFLYYIFSSVHRFII